MIVTNQFVFIHMPKTGGTFVTEVLRRLHSADPIPCSPAWPARLMRGIRRRLGIRTMCFQDRYGPIANLEPKHGTCHDIPKAEQTKPILSVVRNPYDWYVSQYEFAWWKKTFLYHPEPHPTPVGDAIERVLPEFQSRHPHFPEISFPEFMDLCRRAGSVYDRVGRSRLGLCSHGFIRFYYREVEAVLSKLTADYLSSERHRSDRFDVRFMRTNRLNDDLYHSLMSVGYRAEHLVFILELGKILPMGRGRQEHQNWERYYTPKLKQAVRTNDWPLFQMFPEFDV